MKDSLPEIEFWRDPTNWYDWVALKRGLFALRDHGALKASSLWRQTTGEKNLEIDIHLPENGVIFCDGIYLLHQPVVDWLDAVVVLEVASGTALERSAARDAHRNDGIYQRFKESVANEFDQPYFAKNRGAADRVISL
jgi:uridine kinase